MRPNDGKDVGSLRGLPTFGDRPPGVPEEAVEGGEGHRHCGTPKRVGRLQPPPLDNSDATNNWYFVIYLRVPLDSHVLIFSSISWGIQD